MFQKYFRRLICLFLAFLIAGAMIPTGVSAEGTDTQEATPEEVKAQLKRMYHQVLQVTQTESLDGLCATLVTWELYIKGINRVFVSGDGKDQFDNYCNEDVTTGGYYIHALSAEDYTLEEALQTITNNGTRNAYNILIGFEKTRSAAGALYGHTVFIGGIIDGTVYYVESNDYTVGGVTYTEGTPIGCSIEQFAAEYAGWATFEGAIEFAAERYLDQCEVYPTDLYIQTDADTALRTEPCYPDRSNWSYEIRNVRRGEIFRVDAIIRDTEGDYWYRAADVKDHYFPAEDTHMLTGSFDRVTAADVEAPGVLEAGDRYSISGTVSSRGSEIRMIRCQVYTGNAGEGILVENAMDMAQAQRYDLADSDISDELSFRDLEPGVYHYVISAIVRNSYLEDGEVRYQWKLMDLWNAEFLVTEDADAPQDMLVVPLDAAGGEAAVNQAVVPLNGAFTEAVTPVRHGYRFDGWYQDVDGWTRGPFLTAQYALPAYAGWTADTEGFEGWHLVDGLWRCYEDGTPVTGLLERDGVTCYIHEDGTLHTGWLEEGGEDYYFFENGAAAFDFAVIDGEEYFFDHTGAVTEAWIMN